MNLSEEQLEEIEVLQSIYGDSFKQDKNRLWIKVDTIVGEVEVEAVLSPDYPQVVPELKISCSSHKLVISDAIKALKKEAEGLVGMAMIFSLITFLEDWILAQSKGKQKRLVLLEDTGNNSLNETKITLIEEKVLAAGTPVTRESFLKWQKAFLAETSNAVAVQSSKLTGKQLFEQNRGLAASDAGFAEEGEEVVIDESLFASLHFEDVEDADEELIYDNNGNISD